MNEIVKAGAAALATAFFSQVVNATGVFGILTDPDSPSAVMEERLDARFRVETRINGDVNRPAVGRHYARDIQDHEHFAALRWG